ncbi:MAG: DUF1587 domain-containing protein [Pirellulaceae bacterium]
MKSTTIRCAISPASSRSIQRGSFPSMVRQEGFINTGSAQSISPSFITKYLDAAKEVAEHVVLLPDPIRFSPYTTRRDQTDELLARIRAFYRKFTAEGTGTTVDLQGIKFDTNQGGVLPLREYLTTTLMERDALSRGEKSIEAVADEWSLNTKYLSILWKSLSATHANENASSLYLADIRHRWADAAPQDAAKLVALTLRQPNNNFGNSMPLGNSPMAAIRKSGWKPLPPSSRTRNCGSLYQQPPQTRMQSSI